MQIMTLFEIDGIRLYFIHILSKNGFLDSKCH